VKSESEHYLGLLERRLDLLSSLAKALGGARSDFIAMDIEAIRGRIREQEQFCAQIHSLDNDITSAQVRCAKLSGVRVKTNEISWPQSGDSDEDIGARILVTMRRVAAAQTELKRLNDAHRAMLRRSHRSVNVLLNLMHSYAPTYAAPITPQTGTICEERV
jgi:hypothetical protein